MLSADRVNTLISGEHGDPFALLGPHREDPEAPRSPTWVRALLPGALQIEVVRADATPDPADSPGASLAALDQIHADGLFEGRLDQPPPLDYRLRVHYPLGHTVVIDDPYRFASEIGELDRHLLGEGRHLRPWTVLGARPCAQEGVAGVRFALWAPNASRVAVVGDFNSWDERVHGMRPHPGAGLWELFIPGLDAGVAYKYQLRDQGGQPLPAKADPYAFRGELRPATASVVAPEPPERKLPEGRAAANDRSAAISIYEVHLGSWRRGPASPDQPDAEAGAMLDWDALSEQLPAYAAELGFTHIELLPVAEHPFDGSWGYQVIGMYAPSARFGPPEGFARFVAACHAAGLGVLLDWVPAHFPTDEHGLAEFDGTALYEYADPREGFHEDWNTLIYNFGRNEVQNFLVGNALYWLERWGVDGLRVDAVASMLYRDYSRAEGQWIPNAEGGRENLEAIAFLKRMNEVVGGEAPGAITVAEESTAWPGVSRPTSAGGLGFYYKWNMGWMHDSLDYMGQDPVHRKYHHNRLTFGLLYAFDENFVLPLSHDEVVHGKGSMIAKMPGDRWQQFANLRAYYGFMWTHPGKKLLFMGGEFAQEREWNHDRSLDWHLLDEHHPGSAEHRGVQALIRDLNAVYRELPALHALDCEGAGFEWVQADDVELSVYSFLRKGPEPGQLALVVCNFTPVPRYGYRVGVPAGVEAWRERLNTDSNHYGGSNVGNVEAALTSEAVSAHGRPRSVALTLPPLATLILVPA
ncbi:1,4-alpha-glucan branching protein GlgB [Pseudenhygromyxa sp. WMMC2535]|uniref:1,4-alpha-glucan branching protein GlgB n=1 Tax=Pseudenhygromyxa sp. WMMC2535 TaxID=2712867 RepID=UPI001554E605|nr:1,4-alpha-glucan branching protein GlgB [Pseudenhygromyxa sp. WMMC2535]NVB36741.1 1,4-alpha-glucan branching protein GlgB [Pseudenhygromyxa sp. WMMC2535]